MTSNPVERVQTLLAEYGGLRSQYEDFERACRELLIRLLEIESVRVHSVGSRIKAAESLRLKLLRDSKHYGELADVTDLVGIRVITFFADEVDRIGAIIEREFEIDRNNSVDKRTVLDPDRFG